MTYLDHTGATLYSETQLKAHFEDISSNLYANPHSQNVSSQTTILAVEHMRDFILHHFKTDSDSYEVVFTSGCTGALKLLSEIFPWKSKILSEQVTERVECQKLYDYTHGNQVAPKG